MTHDSLAAERHFSNLLSKATNVFVKARAHYWLGRVMNENGNAEKMRNHFAQAAQYPNTFYGQMAIDELYNIEPVLFFGKKRYDADFIDREIYKRDRLYEKYFDNVLHDIYNKKKYDTEITHDSYKIGIMLLKLGRKDDAKKFFISVIETNKARIEVRQMLDNIKGYVSDDFYSSLLVKAVESGILMVDEHYVVDYILKSSDIKEKSLVHSIIKRESKFKAAALSRAGARGLMQIMPNTAKILSDEVGTKYNKNRLSNDPEYNLRLGCYYIQKLLYKFDNSYPLAIASYNAGWGNVSKWLKIYGEPRSHYEMIDFIENIPFKETRDYVMRVMESEGFYSYLLHKKFDWKRDVR
jgi:soluble lytic murein transglycosylase